MTRREWTIVAALTVLALAAPLVQAWNCTTYQNSRAGYIWGVGPVCWQTGGGCQECNSGSWWCVADSGSELNFCIDYQY
jgi:hypothetical protein